MNKVFKILIWFVSIVSIIALGITLKERYEVETSSNKVEIVLDYNAFEELEVISKMRGEGGKDTKWWLTQLRNYGATSVAIIEDSILSLMQEGADIDARTYRELETVLNFSTENEAASRIQQLNLDYYDIVLQTSNETIFNRIVTSFQKYNQTYIIDHFESLDTYYIILDSNKELATKTSPVNNSDIESNLVYTTKEISLGKLVNVGIGLDPNKVAIAKEIGYTIIPRINVTLQTDRDLVALYKEMIEEFDLAPTMYIAADKEVIGYPGKVTDFANMIKDNEMTVLLIETNVQRNNIPSPGLEQLIHNLEYNQLARGLTMSGFVQKAYRYLNYDSSQEITNMLYRAISERNIRAIYFRPFLDGTKLVTDIQAYEDTLRDLSDRIEKHNLSYGTVKPFDEIDTSYIEKVLMSLGLLMSLLVLLNYVFKVTPTINIALLVTGLICIGGALFVAPNLSLQIITLGYAITVPTLGITIANHKVKEFSDKEQIGTMKLIGISTIQVTIITLLSILGGLFLYGLMAKTSYLVEIDLFRGVKIGQLLPMLAAVIIVCFSLSGNQEAAGKDKFINFRDGFTKILNVNIKIKHLILFAIIGLIGYIYIARTGHESNLKVSSIEIMIRNFFEYTLPARPRTKEIFIGLPMLFTSLYLANRYKYKVASVAVIIATIGQASILNTFQHQRTAMDISIIRTLIGLVIGILVGILYILGIELIKKVNTIINKKIEYLRK